MFKFLSIFILTLIIFSGCVDLGPIDHEQSFEVTNNVEDWRDEVIYQLFTDRFYDGDPSNNYNVDYTRWGRYHGGDWQGIIDKLDYLQELGVTTLWISPVVKNVEEDAGFSSYHGYWTQDFKDVNPHFGDMAKLREMVKEAHKRDMKVILDIVVNHIGQLFYYDINGNGYPDDYLIGGNGQPYGNRTSDFPSPLTRTSEWDPEYDYRGVQGFSSLGENGMADIKWMYVPEINRVPPMPEEFQNPNWYNRKGRVTVWWNYDNNSVGWRAHPDVCDWVNGADIDGDRHYLLEGGVCEAEEPDCTPCKSYIRQQETKGDFPGGLKDIKTDLPEVQKAFVDVFTWWIEMADFDGFRIDTVKHVEHEFWQEFAKGIRKFTREKGKKFLLFGEVFDGDDTLIGSYTKNNELDSNFYFSQKFWLESVVKSGGATANLETLYNMRLTNYCNDPNEPGCEETYETHGTTASRLLVNFLDNHDVNRFLFTPYDVGESSSKPEKSDVQALHVALMYLLTWDGIPCIYYGTEQNFHGGNDPRNREDMWVPKTEVGYVKPFNTTNVTFKMIQSLIKIRKSYLPMTRGEVRVVYTSGAASNGTESDAGIFAFEKTYNGQSALVVINFNPNDSKTATISNSLSGSLENVFPDADANSDAITGGNSTITVPARGVKIYVPSADAAGIKAHLTTTYNPDEIDYIVNTF